MVWGMFSSAEVGSLIQTHGRVNTNVYQNLLQQYVVPSLQASTCNFHARQCFLSFLEAKNTEIMKWPAQRPDLNSY